MNHFGQKAFRKYLSPQAARKLTEVIEQALHDAEIGASVEGHDEADAEILAERACLYALHLALINNDLSEKAVQCLLEVSGE